MELQPCFNRDVLRDLSDRATTARLDLEAWAEGENIQYDISRTQERQYLVPDENDIDLQISQAANSGNLSGLREWIARFHSAPDAAARFTRVFLAAVSEAPDDALSILLETNMIDLLAEDDINERNCLHKAAIAGRAPVMQAALRGGVDPSRPDIYGRIPLHYACLKGRVEMAQALIAADPSTVDQLDHDNFTPLIHSITRHQIACVHLLLDRQARIDPISESDHIPLNLACQYGAAEIATLLLQRGAKLLPDAEGLYPQHLVARSDQSLQLLLILQSYGADLDQKDKLYQWTPLFHAASEGQVEGVRCLLDKGVDIDVLDEKNLSAMYYATWEGHLECMKLLWDRSLPARQAREAAASTSEMAPTSSFLMDTTPLQSSAEGDGIPDLSLPPPIIPLRRYGHNFLDTKTFISISFPQGTKSILFFNEGRYPAARMTISSKSSDLIPRNIQLPMQEDSSIVSFQVDNLESFAVEFEIFPTFGSKIIAKSVALPDVFRALSASSGSCCLPLFDPRLRAIGQISFSFQVIKPYSGIPLEITHFATYWKATNADDAGHGGLITGSSLTGDYVQLFVQLTRDAIPVLFPTYSLRHSNLEVPICQLTYQEFIQLGIEVTGVPVSEKLRLLQASGGDSLASLHTKLASSFLTLKDILATLPTSIHVNITVIYPSAAEEIALGLRSTPDINTYADAILNDVFEHTRASKEQNPDFMRSIVFTSYNTNICTALNWKQPNCRSLSPSSSSPVISRLTVVLDPVLLSNDLGEARYMTNPGLAVRSSGQSSMSIKDAARLAQNNNFMGVICRSSILVSGTSSLSILYFLHLPMIS